MIEIQNLTFKLKDKLLFDHFNLKIEDNEKIIFSAPSGKGKTTLFRILLGFEPKFEGNIFIDHIPLEMKNVHLLHSHISYVSQDVDLKDDILIDLLKEVFHYKQNRNINLDKKKLFSLLEILKLPKNILQCKTSSLSGGERQRIGFILALLLKRNIILLDEVTASVDLNLKKAIEKEILAYKGTVVVNTHDTHWDKDRFKEIIW